MVTAAACVPRRYHIRKIRQDEIFWSWQSDTPGHIGRYLVRDVLKDAIKKLKQAEEIPSCECGWMISMVPRFIEDKLRMGCCVPAELAYTRSRP